MSRRKVVLAILLAAGLCLVFQGCGSETDVAPVPNHPPMVRITGGPPEGGTASYTSRIYWTGWDDDGVIDHYELAVDPPPELTLDEIMNPEGSGLSVVLAEGFRNLEDTLIVSKVQEDGRMLTFSWVQSHETSQSFTFQTPEADSAFDPARGRIVPLPTFSGIHTIYLRARDNEGLYSQYKPDGEEEIPPFRHAFNARTITPVAKILYPPRIYRDLVNVTGTFTVRWQGEDPDFSSLGGVVGYFYKLVDLTEVRVNCLNASDPSILFTFTSPNDSGWVYQSADTTEHTFHVPNNHCFLVGVRAVDAAGAVEPFLDLGRNAFKCRSVTTPGWPQITLSEPYLGRFVFDYPGESFEGQAPTSVPLRFTWSATGEAYGEVIEGFSWGMDIVDLEQEGPEAGWSPWGLVSSSPVIRYEKPGLHVFYIRVRDTAGTVNIGQLAITIVPVSFDREVLYVDDYGDATYPRDSEHDAFWSRLFDPVNSEGRLKPGDVFHFESLGPGDLSMNTVVPSLEFLFRHRLIVWVVHGKGSPDNNATTALGNLGARSPVLGAYLRAGGQLWVNGLYSVGAMSPNRKGSSDLLYPKQSLGPGSFIWDFMKIRSSLIDNDRGEDPSSTFWRAIPADSVLRGLPHAYDAMQIDRSKMDRRAPRTRGIPGVDAIFDPIFAESEPGFRGDLDTLYVYGAAGPLLSNYKNRYHLRVCALRWHDPDPAPEHGPVQWFGFPMYYFKQAEAQDTFNKTLYWFREHRVSAGP